MIHDSEVVGVNRLEVCRTVGGVLHSVLEGIEGHKDGGAARGGDFGPESLEDGPGDVGIAGSELTEAE